MWPELLPLGEVMKSPKCYSGCWALWNQPSAGLHRQHAGKPEPHGGPGWCGGCCWLATGQLGCVWPRQAGGHESQGRWIGLGPEQARGAGASMWVVCATACPCPPALQPLGATTLGKGHLCSLQSEQAPPKLLLLGMGSSRSTHVPPWGEAHGPRTSAEQG